MILNIILLSTSVLLLLITFYLYKHILSLYDNESVLEKRIDLLQSQIDDGGWIYLDFDLDKEK